MNKPRRSPSQTSTYVALLRGINVGGKNRLPMSALVAMFEGCRCGEVRSYIQSGNVVFRADAALAARVPQLVAKCIADDFGFDAPLIVRTADDLREVGRSHPYLAALAGAGRLEGPSGPPGPSGPVLDKFLHVAFLATTPAKDRIDALDPNRSPPDVFTVRGREIYLYFPNGMAKTKLSNAYFDSKLATTSTMRNWNTVQKLVAMMES